MPSTHQITIMTQASHQSKDAKRAKLKPPEKPLTHELEEIDIGGHEGAGQLAVDPEERATLVVENLDMDDLEVDVVSVGGGDSPQNTASGSPISSDRKIEESKREIAGAPADVEDNRNFLQESTARGNSSSLLKEELAKTGEVEAKKDTSLGNLTEVGKLKAGTFEGRINSKATNRIIAKNNSPKSSSRIATKESPVHTNNRPPARDSLAQCSSPSRAETGAKSLLGSLALKKDVTEVSPLPAKENSAKRRVNPEVRKSFVMEGKTESEELVDKLVEAPMRPRPRPGKAAELIRMAKHVDASQPLNLDATPESGARGPRDGEGSGLSGRETEAEVFSSSSRPLRDGPWRHNPDGPGLLGKPVNLGKAAGDFSKRPSPIKSVADFRKPSPGTVAAGELRKPSPVKPVGDLRKPSPAKAAGDVRKPSPATSNAHKLAQNAQKEPQKFDQVVSRDSNRAVSGPGKLLSSCQVEERPEGGSSLNGRASNDTLERPIESQRVKRQLDDSSSEPPRMYKKPSIAPVAPSSSLNRGVSDSGAAKPTERKPSSSLNRGVSDSGAARPTERKQVSPDFVNKPQNSESGRGGPLEVPTNLAGPSGKASVGENGRKQRPLGRSQKSSATEAMEPPRGRDWKAKISAGSLRPGDDKKKRNLQSDPALSIGKDLKSSSSPEEVSGKAYFVKFEKDAPDLRLPIRSFEE